MNIRNFIIITLLSIGTASAGLSKLEALGLIETGNDDGAIGRAGEVSRYQIKPWVWHQYAKSEAYRNRQISSKVAEKYLTELEQTFQKRTGRRPEDFDLYVLWNAGPTYYGKVGFSKRRVHPVIRERAERYANLRQIKVAKEAQPAQSVTGTPSTQGPSEAPGQNTSFLTPSPVARPLANFDMHGSILFGLPNSSMPEGFGAFPPFPVAASGRN